MVLQQLKLYNDIQINKKHMISIIINFVNKITNQNYTTFGKIVIQKDKLILNNNIVTEFKDQFLEHFDIKLKELHIKNIILILNKLLSKINFELNYNKQTKTYTVIFSLYD